MKWRRNDRDAADLNISMHTMFLNEAAGYALSARIEAQNIERFTGVLAHEAQQMAREVIMIQNGVGMS